MYIYSKIVEKMYSGNIVDAQMNKKACEFILKEESIQIHDGETTLNLPKQGLKISLSNDKKLVYINHPDYKYYVETSQINLLNDPEFDDLVDEVKRVAHIRKDGSKIKLFLFGILFILLVPIGSIVFFRDKIVDEIASKIPESLELKIGKQYIEELQKNNELINDSLVNAIFQEKANLVLNHIPSGDSFKLYISNSKDINAYALPGKYIVFNKGLLKEAESWDEVLGVMGHEAAHITQKHHSRGMISQVGISSLIGLFFGDGTGLSALLLETGGKLEQLGYSRNFESEADNKGLEYLQKARINPEGLITFFQKLQKIEKDNAKVPEILSTHPSSEKRIIELENKVNLAKQKYIELGDYKDFQTKLK